MSSTPIEARGELEVVRGALGADYEIMQELGRGGMAIVYRAVERAVGREVAIKVLPPHLAFDEAFVERFQREGRVAAQLEHPHIVPIYRVGRSGHVVYIVMQLLRGGSLSDRLRESGRLPATVVRRILAETASALGYASRRGVVHRDVKPDNIMLDDSGHCVVTDFGIARSASESRLTATGMSIGTPRYMSPEQARGLRLDGRSDIYSLGVVGYECLVGRPPFDGAEPFAILMKHIGAPLPRPALATHEEWALFEVIERMLAKEPGERYRSTEELVAALESGFDAATQAVRMTAAAPTMPHVTIRTSRIPAAPDEGPRPSAALDRALAVGLDLLRQQTPRVRAGLRRLRAQQPKVEAAVTMGRALAVRQVPRARAVVGAATRGTAAATGFVVRRGRRFWRWLAGLGLVLAVVVAASWTSRAIAAGRSRCPRPQPVAGSGAAASPAEFQLLVDDIDRMRSGGDLDVRYDVCGLDAGTRYTTEVEVWRSASGLGRLLARAAGPITARYDDTARGPAERRHHTLALDGAPAGPYVLDVSVTDEHGRRRERQTEFRIERRQALPGAR